MYWTHLIFALLHGLLIGWLEITASKPGYLDFDNLPETNFSCDGKVIGGYYADVETGCQMFHVCTIGQKAEVTDIKFLCLNGTVFDQETRVCERIDEVDCSKSEDFFGLNLELYGNSANFGGIQPEGEFGGDCEEDSECSTDEEYEEEPTTLPSTTSTTTTRSTTTTSTTTPRPTPRPYSADTIQALLALHSAFNKPPPPRVINNAFSPKPTTRRPPDLNLGYKSRYTPDSQSYGSLNLQQRERPYYFTTATEKSNYHHFHSGDTSFGHSFDATRPYNFQYFHSRKLPDDKGSVSVVTSTSTSTSVKTSKGNATEYPTGYEDYQDDISDHAFFEDVPKLRQKRELHPNHRYDNEETTTPRHKNHKYEDKSTPVERGDKEEFLQNLLGSIDLDEQVREKMTDFFKKEDEEIDSTEKEGNPLMNFGNKIGQVFTEGMTISKTDEKKSNTDKISEWAKHLNDMNKDISLNYTFEINFTDSNYTTRPKREAQRTSDTSSELQSTYTDERPQARRINIDTEKFRVESRRKAPSKTQTESKPVWEPIQDDLTTVEYRKSSKKGRSQPRSTTSLRAFTYNYELTTAIPQYDSKHTQMSRVNPFSSKEITDFVHEGEEHPLRKGPIYKVEGRQGTTMKKSDEGNHTERPSAGRHRARVVVAKRTKLVEQTTESSSDYGVPRASRPRQRAQPLRGRARQQSPVEVARRKPELQLSVQSAEVTEGRLEHIDVASVTPKITASHVSRGSRRRPSNILRPTTVDYEELHTTPPARPAIVPDPDFSCEGKVKGGFYADLYSDCRGFFICSQGAINGPLLKTHFLCGDKTKFNQRSRTCQAEDLVECEISPRYFHLNNDFLVPVSEDELKGSFEPMKES